MFTLVALILLLFVIIVAVWIGLSLKYSEKVGCLMIELKNKLVGERKNDE